MLQNQQNSKLHVDDQNEKRWYSAKELFETGADEIPKLWDPFLAKTGLAMLTGASDCGKSTLLRQMSLSIVRQDETFLDYKLNAERGVAYYVSTEDGIDALASSMRKQIPNNEFSEKYENLKFLVDSEDLLGTLDEALSKQPADLVVIDTWSDHFHGNPNDFAAVRKDLARYNQLAHRHHCLIILLHHNVKNSEKDSPDKDKVNGSQAIVAKMRTLLELRKGAQLNERLLTAPKCNHLSGAMKQKSLVLEFDEERLMMHNTNKIVLQTALAGEATKQYDPAVWLPRFRELRDTSKLSIVDCQKQLAILYPDEVVPGTTWFKTHGKLATDGPSTPQEFSGPTEKPKLSQSEIYEATNGTPVVVVGQSEPMDSIRPTDKPKLSRLEVYELMASRNPKGLA